MSECVEEMGEKRLEQKSEPIYTFVGPERDVTE